jgi:hypothetical protein
MEAYTDNAAINAKLARIDAGLDAIALRIKLVNNLMTVNAQTATTLERLGRYNGQRYDAMQERYGLMRECADALRIERMKGLDRWSEAFHCGVPDESERAGECGWSA